MSFAVLCAWLTVLGQVGPGKDPAKDSKDSHDKSFGTISTCTSHDCGELKGEEMVELPESRSTQVALERGRRFVQSLYHGNGTSLWDQASPELKKQFPTVASMQAFVRKLNGDFGEEVRVIDESTSGIGTLRTYKRAGIFTHYARGVVVELTWDEKNQLTEMLAHPATTEAPSPHLEYEVKTALKLPFEGTWNVLWGGRTIDVNAHSAVSDERFALDLFIIRGPSTYAGDGKSNEQYYCFGKNVLAPASGIVVEVSDGLADNSPGSVNPTQLYGNHIVLDHGGGEFSLFGHLMKGSLQVKKGQVVFAGQTIARAGNSGVSTEPHLHYQLMDNAEWVKAHGYPSVFVDYSADGKPVERGEPRRGQAISRH